MSKDDTYSTRYGDTRRSIARTTLDREDLVVVIGGINHPILYPRFQVARHADAAGDSTPRSSFGVTNGPELLEGLSAINRWGVGASRHVNIVYTAVGGDCALLLSTRRWVVSTE